MRRALAAPRLVPMLASATFGFHLAASAANIAAPGAGILGLKTDTDGTLGGFRYNSGVATNIIDGSLTTRVDNHLGNDARSVSFVGVIWPGVRYEPISSINLTLATFGDGGWFGVPGAPAPAGGALAATNLIEPLVQVTTNRGTSWVTVASMSDYQTVMLGHQIGGTGGQPNPSSRTSTFTFSPPVTAINGIRILGTNGGRAGADTNGFLGVFDFAVQGDLVDADMDGISDAWEAGTGATDPAGDDDADGLANLQEYQLFADPNVADSDGDGLPDGDEVIFYSTSPVLADTDGDTLTDDAEINVHGTNPVRADTDADGLSDAAEINTYGSNPLLADGDGDLFNDRLEVLFGGNPNNAMLFPDNLALIGTNMIGVKDSLSTGVDTPYSQQAVNVRANINDGNLTTRVDTYNGSTVTTVSYVGIAWPFMITNPITYLDLTMATFLDGGWFGVNNLGPGGGNPLTAAHLTEPLVQVSTNGGTDWVTVPFSSDYTNKLLGHRIGSGGLPNPTSVTVVFTLATPATHINAVRVIGTEGGTASRGFLGVFELMARKEVSDSDADGMSDSWELANGLNVGVNDAALDADSDGLANLDEFNTMTNPQVPDSDSDGLTDGAEVHTHLTSPVRADTDADGLNDGAELSTYSTDPLKKDSDNDGFWDGLEIAQMTSPSDGMSFPSNLALMGSATGIIGVKTGIDGFAGTAHSNAGGPPNVNDGNVTTRVDTWNGGGGETASYVGITWTNLVTTPIVRLELTLATFFDGGWFGVNGIDPGTGGRLTSQFLVEPTVQVTTNGGMNWVTVPHASDYLTVMTNHNIGGGAFPNPSSVRSHFIFIQPLTNINGVRIIGSEGGTASGGFLGVFELAARHMVADTDDDGMNDEWEGFHGLIVGTDDSEGDADGDGLPNKLEFEHNANPNVADTDGDTLGDGDEVLVHATSPTKTDSDNDGLGDAAELNTHGTSPRLADTDGDGFPDGMEILQGTSPTDSSSHALNYSLVGRGILGTKATVDGTLGTLVFNSGGASAITDGDLMTRVDSYANNGQSNSFVGVLWDRSFTNITRLKLSLATFFDGGWFGVNNIGPGSGAYLSNSIHLLEPVVQVTSDGGVTWTTVPHTSDYLTALDGHPLPPFDFGEPTLATAHFQLGTAQTNINGIRIVGSEGGQASAGFLGVFDLNVSQLTAAPVTIENVTLVGDQIRFEFDSQAGITHYIQARDSLDAPWENINVVIGDGTSKTVMDSTTAGAMRLYRIDSK